MDYLTVLLACFSVPALLKAYIPEGYLGCYEDKSERIFKTNRTILPYNCGETCKRMCKSKDYRYAGTKNAVECFCGRQFKKYMYPEASGCNMKCPGDLTEFCGGHQLMSIYDTWEIQATERPTEVTSTFSKSSVDDLTTQFKLPKGKENNSSSISVYVLFSAGCVVVLIIVVVVVFCRRKLGKYIKRKHLGNDDQAHIYYEVDELQSQENNGHVNEIYAIQLPHTLESCQEYSEGQKVSANQYDYVSNHGSSMYLTPVYSTGDYSSIDLHTQSIPGNTDGRYEELRNNNICENEYELLHTSSKSKE